LPKVTTDIEKLSACGSSLSVCRHGGALPMPRQIRIRAEGFLRESVFWECPWFLKKSDLRARRVFAVTPEG
jgi:hypothetical protein